MKARRDVEQKTAGTDNGANDDRVEKQSAAQANLRKCKSSTGQILLDAPDMPAHSLPNRMCSGFCGL